MTKTKLPTKTKIAVWWTFIVGLACVALTAFFLGCSPEPESKNSLWIGIAVALLYIFPCALLYMKNKLAWKFAIAITSLELIIWLIYLIICAVDNYKAKRPIFSDISFLIYPILLIIIPLILLILDRKNYFEMARQRELEKKDSAND
jgi:hypothetical protein